MPLPAARSIRRSWSSPCLRIHCSFFRFVTSLLRPLAVRHDGGLEFRTLDLRVGQDGIGRSEEHTSELQSLRHLVCRLLLEKKKKKQTNKNKKKTKRKNKKQIDKKPNAALNTKRNKLNNVYGCENEKESGVDQTTLYRTKT